MLGCSLILIFLLPVIIIVKTYLYDYILGEIAFILYFIYMYVYCLLRRNMREIAAQSQATDEKRAQQLWDISMELCGLTSQQQWINM